MDNFYFLFNRTTTIKIPRFVNKSLLKDIWQNSTFGLNKLNIEYCDSLTISIGDAKFIPLGKNTEYTLKITNKGVGVIAKDQNSLMRGFMAIILRFIQKEYNDKVYATLPIGEVIGDFLIDRRMAQICVFPEYDYYFVRKLARYLCALQYTHIVIEFFGMYKYKCFKELGYKNALTYKQVKTIINEIRSLGAEPVPMFNSLGHAFGTRGCTGKHVVLDQNPKLAYMYTPDGWSWDITNQKVIDKLQEVRKELYSLFGEGEFFMIGCDECEIYSRGYVKEEVLQNYLYSLTSSIANEGRKPIIWADMFLYRQSIKEYETRVWSANAHSQEQADKFLKSVHKNTIIADWQYQYASSSPCSQYTAIMLKEKGCNVIACPFFDINVIRSTTKTVIENNLFGYLQTIWDRAHEYPWIYIDSAILCGMPKNLWYEFGECSSIIAGSVLRKVTCGPKKYSNFGFIGSQFVKNSRPSN